MSIYYKIYDNEVILHRQQPQLLGRSLAARVAGFQPSCAFSSVRYLDTHEYIRLEGKGLAYWLSYEISVLAQGSAC